MLFLKYVKNSNTFPRNYDISNAFLRKRSSIQNKYIIFALKIKG